MSAHGLAASRASVAARIAAVVGLLLVVLAGSLVPDGAAAACRPRPGPRLVVAQVVDAETLAMADGSAVRLVGALAPRPPDARLADADWPPARAARAHLERLVLGRTVELRWAAASPREDRYGRALAQVHLGEGADAVWVQAAMVGEGHARVYGHGLLASCLAELLEHERSARSAGKGLWAHESYAVLAADRPHTLSQRLGTFQIIEGTVTSVGEDRGRPVLGFGDSDGRGLTFRALLEGRDRRAFERAGLELESLEGKRLRLRGWLVRWRGPALEIASPDEVELVE